MHHSDYYYRTTYSSQQLSRFTDAFDGLGNVLPRTTLQDGKIQPALVDYASIY
jgi:hypothetical protein